MKEMIMPQNYVELEQEEMMYLDGGWSWGTVSRNLGNLYRRFRNASRSLIGSGITLGFIWSIGKGASSAVYWHIARALMSVAAVNVVVGAVLGVSAGAAIYAVGQWNIF